MLTAASVWWSIEINAVRPLGLFFRPCSICFPKVRFIWCLCLLGIALAVARFLIADVQSPKVFTQSVAHEGRTISLRTPRRMIGSD